MENDCNPQPNPAFHQIQMRVNGQHQYPHSHHGTPAAEYAGFVWPSPPEPTAFGHNTGQRPNHQSLHPLVMPQWPSMLSSQPSQANPTYYPTVAAQGKVGATSPTPIITPVSASSTRSGSTPRRTLTDDERRKMCEYHELVPSAKQNEIGAMFGVERSTVSKVLRQKEKYLQKPSEVIRSPERRTKGKSPDIERTLANWVIKEQKKGSLLSDEVIREKAQYFSSVSGPDNAAPNPANNAAWLKNFKRKHNIVGRKSSRDHSSSEELCGTSKADPGLPVPKDISPVSPKEDESPSPRRRTRGMCSDESLEIESAEGFDDLTRTLSAESFSAAFADTPTSCFSPNPLLSSSSPFFTPDSATAPLGLYFQRTEGVSSPTTDNFHRPRRQTFPMLFQDVAASEVLASGTQYLAPSTLDVAMDDIGNSLASIDEAMDNSSSADTDMNITQLQATTHAHTMRPPPPPMPNASCKEFTLPSQEEARQALQVLWQYFANQPTGSDGNLNMEETAMMGRFMERLKERNRDQGGG